MHWKKKKKSHDNEDYRDAAQESSSRSSSTKDRGRTRVERRSKTGGIRETGSSLISQGNDAMIIIQG